MLRPHGAHYALFKTTPLYHTESDLPEEADCVVVRTADFAKRSPKIAAQLKAYLRRKASGARLDFVTKRREHFSSMLQTSPSGKPTRIAFAAWRLGVSETFLRFSPNLPNSEPPSSESKKMEELGITEEESDGNA